MSKITQLKVHSGNEMFWLTIKRKMSVVLDNSLVSFELVFNIHNHDTITEEVYINVHRGVVNKDLSASLIKEFGNFTVSEILSIVNLKIEGFKLNQEKFSGIEESAKSLEFSIMENNFYLEEVWFERRIEFVYNRQIRVDMVADYFLNFVTGVNKIEVNWDKINYISLMRNRNINGVEVEHLIEDKSVIVDNCVIENDAIENFLLGYFFGCVWGDNVFFDEAEQRVTNFEAIYKEFCSIFNIISVGYALKHI